MFSSLGLKGFSNICYVYRIGSCQWVNSDKDRSRIGVYHLNSHKHFTTCTFNILKICDRLRRNKIKVCPAIWPLNTRHCYVTFRFFYFGNDPVCPELHATELRLTCLKQENQIMSLHCTHFLVCIQFKLFI